MNWFPLNLVIGAWLQYCVAYKHPKQLFWWNQRVQIHLLQLQDIHLYVQQKNSFEFLHKGVLVQVKRTVRSKYHVHLEEPLHWHQETWHLPKTYDFWLVHLIDSEMLTVPNPYLSLWVFVYVPFLFPLYMKLEERGDQ